VGKERGRSAKQERDFLMIAKGKPIGARKPGVQNTAEFQRGYKPKRLEAGLR